MIAFFVNTSIFISYRIRSSILLYLISAPSSGCKLRLLLEVESWDSERAGSGAVTELLPGSYNQAGVYCTVLNWTAIHYSTVEYSTVRHSVVAIDHLPVRVGAQAPLDLKESTGS